MKKLIMMSAVMLCGALFAEGEALTSKNIVGYTSTEVEGGKYYLIASQFQNTDSSDIFLEDFVSSSDMKGGEVCEPDTCPVLQLWDGDAYEHYYFLEEDIMGEKRVWSKSLCFAVPPKEVRVNLGVGAFIQTVNDCTITVAGQVASKDAYAIPVFPDSFNLICNPFPMSFDLNDEKLNFGEFLVGEDGFNGPNIKVWDGDDYRDFYYVSGKYWSTDGVEKSDDAIIKPCQGFFFKYSGEEAELIFKR